MTHGHCRQGRRNPCSSREGLNSRLSHTSSAHPIYAFLSPSLVAPGSHYPRRGELPERSSHGPFSGLLSISEAARTL